MKTLTVFTPAYNRVYTIARTYESLCRQTSKDFEWLIIDDGSTDDTRKWVESLGNKLISKGEKFDWMGRRVEGEDGNHFVIDLPEFRLRYVYKPNGGLYTGYNVAYTTIKTELCVAIDSDDFMPDDAVEKIVNLWHTHYPNGIFGSKLSVITGKEYCGIIGLDFYFDKGTPIGGYFPKEMTETYRSDLFIKKIHCGDSKEVMRSDLMRQVAPQIGFEGEKNFNPVYMLVQIWDKYPLLALNENICTVDYQIGSDSMSAGIYKQYLNSPNSFAKMRLLEMRLNRNNWKNLFRVCIHYNSSTIIARDKDWLVNTPRKIMTIVTRPIGWMITKYINHKAMK